MDVMKPEIGIITIADAQYPKRLLNRSGVTAPSTLYYAGDLNLLLKKHVGFVGSRHIETKDRCFIEQAVAQVNARGYGVISGGAEGTDCFAGNASLKNGNTCIHFVSHSLTEWMQQPSVKNAICSRKLLLLSHVSPDTAFRASAALRRNQYIYAQSGGDDCCAFRSAKRRYMERGGTLFAV